jgi:hypothetical protein
MNPRGWNARAPQGAPGRGRSPGHCRYCGVATFPFGSPEALADPYCAATRDHKIPQAFGGKQEGTVLACHGCNNARADAPYEVFSYFMRQEGYDLRVKERRQRFRQFRTLLEIVGFETAKRSALKARRRPVNGIADIVRGFR